MTQLTIVTSRSTIMHASLAYFSPELRTFDSLLQDSSSHGSFVIPSKTRLPLELLILIRQHLLPMVTRHLFKRSVEALRRYESSLRTLLCQNCTVYYEDVYGPDIWHWEQFSGPCVCRGGRSNFDHRVANPEHSNTLNMEHRFTNCSSWLEFYLSFESSQLVAHHDQRHFNSIWDIVDMALYNHGCQISGADRHRSPESSETQIFNTILIIPIKTGIVSRDQNPDESLVALHRASRDLGLSLEYEEGLELWGANTSPCPRSSMPKSHWMYALRVKTRCMSFLQGIMTFIAACLSLPLTVATLALTVLCYYSNPRSLRLI